jgi:hypothetical protein
LRLRLRARARAGENETEGMRLAWIGSGGTAHCRKCGRDDLWRRDTGRKQPAHMLSRFPGV